MKTPTAVYKLVEGKVVSKVIDAADFDHAAEEGWRDSPSADKVAKKTTAKKKTTVVRRG